MANQKYQQEVKAAICASIDNQRWMDRDNCKSSSAAYKIKYIIWYFLLLFLSPKKSVTSKKFVGAMTPVNEIRLRAFADGDEYYKFAKLNSTIKQIRSNRSVLSPYKFKKRLSITAEALRFYVNEHIALRGYLHFTLEYYTIAYWMNDFQPEVIITPGMYDRYCTFLSYLGKQMSIKLIGVQDGAAVDISVPRKLYVDEMYAFDDFEIDIIKSFVENKDCRYISTGFISTIEWGTYDSNNKKIIAIASQDWFTDKTIELVDAVMSRADSDQYTVILYPHYRESVKQYEELQRRYPDLVISDKHRYKNIDVLITFYSTIVYDFWSVNKDLPVLCQRISGFEPGYYGRNNVRVFDNAKELVDFLFQ